MLFALVINIKLAKSFISYLIFFFIRINFCKLIFFLIVIRNNYANIYLFIIIIIIKGINYNS